MPAIAVFIRDTPPHDQVEMTMYAQKNAANTVAYQEYGIAPLVVYGATEALEGTEPDGTVILQFPTMADAKNWYNSPEYQDALQHRLKGSEYRVFFVEGI